MSEVMKLPMSSIPPIPPYIPLMSMLLSLVTKLRQFSRLARHNGQA